MENLIKQANNGRKVIIGYGLTDSDIAKLEKEINTEIEKAQDRLNSCRKIISAINEEKSAREEMKTLKGIINKEIKETGYICDSDNTDRFIKTICNNNFTRIVECSEYLKRNYNMCYSVDDSATITAYYSILKFETVEDLENYFLIGE